MLGTKKAHLLSIATLVVAAAALVAPAAAAPATVGQFLQELAKVKNLDSSDPQVAAEALSAAGVRLPDGLDLAGPLTEGQVASISRASGLKVTATDDTASFDAERIDRFFAVFSNQLRASDSGITARDAGNCAIDEFGACAQAGADCEKNGKPGFCQPANDGCTCNTGKAKGKRKQVASGAEPE